MVIAWWVVLGCAVEIAALPPGFIQEDMITEMSEPVGLTFDASGRLFVWERAGRLYVFNADDFPTTSASGQLLLDLADEVTTWHDHGLLGVAVDDRYIYLFYSVDWHYYACQETDDACRNTVCGSPPQPMHCHCAASLGPDVDPNDTFARLTRYAYAVMEGAITVDAESRTVLIGQEHCSGIPLTAGSHGADTLRFAPDGTLLLSAGDGGDWGSSGDWGETRLNSSHDAEAKGIVTDGGRDDVGAFRAQLADSPNGKILRIDPLTGAGHPSNPFYDATSPDSSQSRLWALGLRNPFRFSIRPGTGSRNPDDGDPGVLYVGDVGWFHWEELNIVTGAGQNFGWPLYEGLHRTENDANEIVYEHVGIRNQDGLPSVGRFQNCSSASATFRDLIVQDTLNEIACQWVHRRPAFTYHHASLEIVFPTFDERGEATISHIGDDGTPSVRLPFRGNTLGGSAFYEGDKWPEGYRHTFFLADAWFSSHSRWIQQIVVNENNQVLEIHEFVPPGGAELPVDMTPDAQGYGLYIVDYLGKVYRISYDCNGNGVGDDFDIALGTSSDGGDALGNGIPDECEGGLNRRGHADTCKINCNAAGRSLTTGP
jgi:glucose/arabinose dehydrogenase